MFNWFSLHYVECSDVRLFWFPICFDYIYKYFAQLLNFILEISAALMQPRTSYSALKYKSVYLKYIYSKIYPHKIMVGCHNCIFTLQQQQNHTVMWL